MKIITADPRNNRTLVWTLCGREIVRETVTERTKQHESYAADYPYKVSVTSWREYVTRQVNRSF